ncbi:MAG: metalloregulator ArsR/SmtB family transcription factor [Pseudomonadota bacterium]
MNIQDFEYKAERAADLLASMAHKGRLMLLCRLVEGEASVNALAQTLAMRQATVSQHLSKLRELGLVKPRRDRQTIYYSLRGPEVRAVLETLYDLYCRDGQRD